MPRFTFLDPGPLVDDELILIEPHPAFVDSLLDSVQRPLTLRDAPEEARLSRDHIERMLETSPHGHQEADPIHNLVPAYHFWMKIPDAIAGGVTLRIGDSDDMTRHYGQIGYHVYPPYRGHHRAARAVRLLLPLARLHGMRELWITCNPDNLASRRTCERLGATLIDIIPIPPRHPLYLRGERLKCRFRLDL